MTVETENNLLMEDRLKATLYQFIKLYERWSEDRQVAAKQDADTAELIQLFTEQVKGFKELEPKVRQQIAASIQTAATKAVNTLSDVATQEATRATEQVVQQLKNAVREAEKILYEYQKEVINSQWKIMGITIFTAIFTGLFVVWLLIPKPVLPLTGEQLGVYQNGLVLDSFWNKLSKKEQNRLLKIGREPKSVRADNAGDL